MHNNDYFDDGNGDWNDRHYSASESPIEQYSSQQNQDGSANFFSNVPFETAEVVSGTL